MKMSGTPHMTWHHFAEDANPQSKSLVVVAVVVVVYLCADVCSLLSSALEQQTFLQIKVNHKSLYCILFLYCNIHMKIALKK